MIWTRTFGLGLAMIVLIAASPAARDGDAPSEDEEQIGKGIFESFSSDRSRAKPLAVPKDVSEMSEVVFLR